MSNVRGDILGGGGGDTVHYDNCQATIHESNTSHGLLCIAKGLRERSCKSQNQAQGDRVTWCVGSLFTKRRYSSWLDILVATALLKYWSLYMCATEKPFICSARINSCAKQECSSSWMQSSNRTCSGHGVRMLPNPAMEIIELESDASGSWGCTAILGSHWLQWHWNKKGQSWHITPKEFLPVLLVCVVWEREWSGKLIHCHCDNIWWWWRRSTAGIVEMKSWCTSDVFFFVFFRSKAFSFSRGGCALAREVKILKQTHYHKTPSPVFCRQLTPGADRVPVQTLSHWWRNNQTGYHLVGRSCLPLLSGRPNTVDTWSVCLREKTVFGMLPQIGILPTSGHRGLSMPFCSLSQGLCHQTVMTTVTVGGQQWLLWQWWQ